MDIILNLFLEQIFPHSLQCITFVVLQGIHGLHELQLQG